MRAPLSADHTEGGKMARLTVSSAWACQPWCPQITDRLGIKGVQSFQRMCPKTIRGTIADNPGLHISKALQKKQPICGVSDGN